MLIKICGLTLQSDADLAESLGADYLGAIMAGGPRAVSIETARLVLGPRRAGVQRVVVFAGRPLAEIARIANVLALDVVQLHDAQSLDHVTWLQHRVDCSVWPVVRVAGTELPEETVRMAQAAGAVLLDAKVVGQLGGTGVALDWHALRSDVDRLRREAPLAQLILAGGLRAGNVHTAWNMLLPDVVDVSSGVETAPGLKNPAAMEAFVKAARHITFKPTDQWE